MSRQDDQLYSVNVTAFVGRATRYSLEPPRDYEGVAGPGRTAWILTIADKSDPYLSLHVKDPAKLWELHDLIAATLPPRGEETDAAGGAR